MNGIHGVMKAKGELVYTNTSKRNTTLNLYAVNGTRDYSNYTDGSGNELIKDDKLFLLEVVDSKGVASGLYPFYTYDIGECVFNIISNKVILSARQREADKIIKRINEALES